MRKINLVNNNGFALVDDADYFSLVQYKWYLSTKGYAVTGRNSKVLMHRLILKPGSDEIIDHIDRNKLNNQRENLRVCNFSQNGANRTRNSTNKTGYKGVRLKDGKYHATVRKNGVDFYLGSFLHAEDAALAYDKKAIELFGEFARLNFETGD